MEYITWDVLRAEILMVFVKLIKVYLVKRVFRIELIGCSFQSIKNSIYHTLGHISFLFFLFLIFKYAVTQTYQYWVDQLKILLKGNLIYENLLGLLDVIPRIFLFITHIIIAHLKVIIVIFNFLQDTVVLIQVADLRYVSPIFLQSITYHSDIHSNQLTWSISLIFLFIVFFYGALINALNFNKITYPPLWHVYSKNV